MDYRAVSATRPSETRYYARPNLVEHDTVIADKDYDSDVFCQFIAAKGRDLSYPKAPVQKSTSRKSIGA